jgi:hypothetical protein
MLKYENYLRSTVFLSHTFTGLKNVVISLWYKRLNSMWPPFLYAINTFLISMTPTIHTLVHIYTSLQLITISYAKLNDQIKCLKQKHTKSYTTKIKFRLINIYMANLLSTIKLSSNTTYVFHPHSEQPAFGYLSNSLLLPVRTAYTLHCRGQSQQNLTQGTFLMQYIA